MKKQGTPSSYDALPAKAKRVLVGELRKPVGTRLAIDWYEFQRGSNFDKYPREKIKEAAESAGFIEYKGGHPWVAEAGHQWALKQPVA